MLIFQAPFSFIHPSILPSMHPFTSIHPFIYSLTEQLLIEGQLCVRRDSHWTEAKADKRSAFREPTDIQKTDITQIVTQECTLTFLISADFERKANGTYEELVTDLPDLIWVIRDDFPEDVFSELRITANQLKGKSQKRSFHG